MTCIKDCQYLAGDTHIDGAPNELMRYRVAHRGNNDVEIWCDFRAFPFGVLPWCLRQIGKKMLLIGFKQVPAA